MQNEAHDGGVVAVQLPLPVSGPYAYLVPPGSKLARGDFVRVPLGRREVIGVVWGSGSGTVDPARLRLVLARLPVPALPDVVCRFVDWVAAYTLQPAGAVLKMAMSVPTALHEETKKRRKKGGGGLPPPVPLD
ncbi:MAG: hypothetical protein HQL37_05535 [Alphaproteobacteria bacterium]|nr:hypothetical protein [Alphaproteobacteria bacterium]